MATLSPAAKNWQQSSIVPSLLQAWFVNGARSSDSQFSNEAHDGPYAVYVEQSIVGLVVGDGVGFTSDVQIRVSSQVVSAPQHISDVTSSFEQSRQPSDAQYATASLKFSGSLNAQNWCVAQ